jgi:hypothetical protein
MRQLTCLLVALGAVSPARADEVMGTRGSIVERRHQIEVVMYPGHARLTVRRTVENLGERHDQAVFHLEFPEELAATGLRTLGLVDGRPRWFPGVLMEAEAAARKYQRLTGIGGAYPKDPALLSWQAPGMLSLQVFPVPPDQQKTIEYTLTAPTEYVHGRHTLRLPQLGTEVSPSVVVRAGTGGDLFVDWRPFPSGGAIDWGWLRSASGEGGEDEPPDGRSEPAVELALEPRRAPTLAGGLALLEVSPGRFLVRYRVEAAPRLSEIPRHAQLVVVLDGSRSWNAKEREAAVAAADAYLGRFEDAEVQVLTFARKAQAVFPGFLPVARAREALAALELRPRNGSNFDQALALADRLLAGRRGGARRVLLLTDLLTRQSLTPARQQRALARSGAVLHIGVVQPGAPALEVRDDDPWSPVARATGGLVWDAAAAPDLGEAGPVFEEWARPVRLHAFGISGRGLLSPEHEPPAILDEGSGTTFIGVIRSATVPLQVWGELWSRPVSLTLRPDAAETRLWSALVFGTQVREELSEPEMMVLARHGRAVSPVTSYLAIEPGVRPSTEGLEETSIGMLGLHSASAPDVIPGQANVAPQFDRQAWLNTAVREAWRHCSGTSAVSVTLETTQAELVEVDTSGSSQVEECACLREALWNLEVPYEFYESWERWTVEL